MKAVGATNNMRVYNPFMLIEFWAFALYFRLSTDLTWLKKVINGFLILFPVLWVVCVFFIFGFRNWNSYVSITGSAFTIFFAVTFYYELLTSQLLVKLRNMPEFWIATGLLIFYAGNLPYLGMLNYLNAQHTSTAAQLSYVLKGLNIIEYSLFTYAFICRSIATS